MASIPDGMVGAMARDIAKNKPESLAPRLLANASQLEVDYAGLYGEGINILVVHAPLDFYDSWDDEIMSDVLAAASKVGYDFQRYQLRLAPESEGWRDRLAEIEDWGPEQELSGSWEVIDERLSDLKGLLARSVTPDDLADVGRRCRELMIAAANATYRQEMLPEGKEAPKDSDAKTKCKYIVASLGKGSVDKRLTKLIERAWDLSAGLTHHKEPSKIAVFSAAQATVLVVRTLERIEADLN